MRLESGVTALDFMPGPKINAGIPHLLYTSNAAGGAVPTRHLWDVSADGQRILQRTAASIAGGTAGGGGVPTLPANFISAGQAPALATTTTTFSAAANNGLTVVRHWTAAFRKAVK